MDDSVSPSVPGGASIHRPHRGRQPVAVGGRPQQAPSEAQHEVQSLGERGGVEAPEGVLVGDVAKFRDDSEASFLDLFQPHGVAVCQRRVPDWSGILEASPDIPLV